MGTYWRLTDVDGWQAELHFDSKQKSDNLSFNTLAYFPIKISRKIEMKKSFFNQMAKKMKANRDHFRGLIFILDFSKKLLDKNSQ